MTADATDAVAEGDLVEDLVLRAREGDREAFASLVHLTSDRLYAIATRILRDGDLAEDALQGALVTAWRQLPTLRDPARFELPRSDSSDSIRKTPGGPDPWRSMSL